MSAAFPDWQTIVGQQEHRVGGRVLHRVVDLHREVAPHPRQGSVSPCAGQTSGRSVGVRRDRSPPLSTEAAFQTLGLHGEGQFDVADRVGRRLHRCGTPSEPLDPGRPWPSSPNPARTARRRAVAAIHWVKLSVVPEPSERWNWAMGASGRLTSRVDLGQGRVVPVRDLVVEDLGGRPG